VKRLFNLFKRRPLQNAAIIGPRRSGKTSLLLYLRAITQISATQLRPGQKQDWLNDPASYRWILVDFQDPRLGTRNGLLQYLLTRLKLPIPNAITLDSFMNVVSQTLQSPTIILLDEIDVALKRYTELDDFFWEGLRALATHQTGGNLAFVLTAQQAPAQLAQHHDLGSPFFNIFGYTAYLKPLLKPEATDLLTSSPMPFSEADQDWIIQHSERWPILMQILCRERLLSLEEKEDCSAWQDEGLEQLAQFQYLLANQD
ncbi:MAG: ATP-binding protein, partial [Chloroflexota bacterium]